MSEPLRKNRDDVATSSKTTTIKVWDPIVRLFHWIVVSACVLNLFILEEGHYWHRVTGYVAAAALAIRILWGFIGTKHARFPTSFQRQ